MCRNVLIKRAHGRQVKVKGAMLLDAGRQRAAGKEVHENFGGRKTNGDRDGHATAHDGAPLRAALLDGARSANMNESRLEAGTERR